MFFDLTIKRFDFFGVGNVLSPKVFVGLLAFHWMWQALLIMKDLPMRD
jgi:hypothetical protein